MSLPETTPPGDTVVVSNGEAITPTENELPPTHLIKETGVASTPDLIHNAPIPVLLIEESKEGKEEEEDDCVKNKPPRGHTRGSSVSSGVGSHGQCETATTTTTNSSASSLSNSFYSHDGRMDTISLPAGLSNIARTSSDPILALTSSLKGKTDKEKEETLTRLVEEVVSLKMEMMRLQEENTQLRKTRTDMDDELHALTENLFEEAYKMVDEAKGEKFSAEKRLADATGQIEAMETQVSTLHNLLKTPSSSSSSKASPTQKHKKPSVKKMIRKLSRKSHHSSSGSKIKESGVSEHKGNTKEWILKEVELPSIDFAAFKEWYDKGLPSTSGSHTYYDIIVSSHIVPCLKFTNDELSVKVHEAIKANQCVLEPIVQKTNPEEVTSTTIYRCCELSGESTSAYRLRLSGSEEEEIKWYYISSTCRERIVSVCDFYTFIGYIQKGIVKKEVTEVYWKIAKFRAGMSISCLSLSLPDILP